MLLDKDIRTSFDDENGQVATSLINLADVYTSQVS